MKRRIISSLVHLLTACLLAAVLTACSAVKRGKVVKKGIDQVGTKFRPGPTYWADVRGENRKGKLVTARVEFFAVDWKSIKRNTWIEPDRYGFPRFFQRIQAYNETQRAESGSFGASERVVRKNKPRSSRRVAARPSPPASTPAPLATSAPEQLAVEPAIASATDRARRLLEVREQALEDPSLRQLKADIKTARTEEEQERAWSAYRSTLRDKMHAIDPSLSDLIL